MKRSKRTNINKDCLTLHVLTCFPSTNKAQVLFLINALFNTTITWCHLPSSNNWSLRNLASVCSRSRWAGITGKSAPSSHPPSSVQTCGQPQTKVNSFESAGNSTTYLLALERKLGNSYKENFWPLRDLYPWPHDQITTTLTIWAVRPNGNSCGNLQTVETNKRTSVPKWT